MSFNHLTVVANFLKCTIQNTMLTTQSQGSEEPQWGLSSIDEKQWTFCTRSTFIYVHVDAELKTEQVLGCCGPPPLQSHVGRDSTSLSYATSQIGCLLFEHLYIVLYNTCLPIAAVSGSFPLVTLRPGMVIWCSWGWGDTGRALVELSVPHLLFRKRCSLFSCLFCLRAFYFGINDA